MARTGKQVQQDVYRLLRNSSLAEMIQGGIYLAGTRPRDSCEEDAIVTFTGGIPGQIDEGVVTVNIYVLDIQPYGEEIGVLVEDMERTSEIETEAQAWVNALTTAVSPYHFRLLQSTQTFDEPDINQHFVVVKLAYRYFDGED